ncbi:hypothetical protein [Streptomyces tendae]|uniref:hypothetical protein n=1 Tax=Streptomyces tendae TaxID=1932 RepID=UPI003EBAE918
MPTSTPLTAARLAQIRALLEDEHRTHDQLEDALEDLLADHTRLTETTTRYAARWDGGHESMTTGFDAAREQALAAHQRGERGAGVASYRLEQVAWEPAAELR